MHDQKQSSSSHSDTQTHASEISSLFPLQEQLSLEEIMRRVRAEVQRRKQESLHDMMQENLTAAPHANRLPHWTPPSAQLTVKPAYSLGELLQWADEDFVETTYRILLRRPADAIGKQAFLTALRNGSKSKVEILGDIRFSPEGIQRGVHVDGLLLPYKLQKWRKKRLVGRPLRWAMALLRLPRLSLQIQMAESHAAQETQRLGALINKLESILEQRIEDIERDLASKVELEMLAEKQAHWKEQLEEKQDRLRNIVDADRNVSIAVRTHVNEIDKKLNEMERRVGGLDRSVELDANVISKLTEVENGANDNTQIAADLWRKLIQLLNKNVDWALSNAHLSAGDEKKSKLVEADYLSFEESFRGTREDIKQRSRYYLSILESVAIKTSQGLVLDLGCGRGEWLEVLTENGYTCRGVDLNGAMLEQARTQGFHVIEADVIDYLRSLDSNSVAAITSMHLVEHLPHDTLIQLLDEAHRVLKPLGVLIIETPNPENLTVGSCWFYMDPTHRNPIPPALLQWVVTRHGFSQADIHRLTENRSVVDIQPVNEDVPGAKQINQLIELVTTAPDYAVVAFKP